MEHDDEIYERHFDTKGFLRCPFLTCGKKFGVYAKFNLDVIAIYCRACRYGTPQLHIPRDDHGRPILDLSKIDEKAKKAWNFFVRDYRKNYRHHL